MVLTLRLFLHSHRSPLLTQSYIRLRTKLLQEVQYHHSIPLYLSYKLEETNFYTLGLGGHFQGLSRI